MKRSRKKLVLLLFIGLFVACNQKPGDIRMGSDECAHCHMIITDPKFASEIVTAKGKVLKFDAIECMAAYQKEHLEKLKGSEQWVTDFNKPGSWMEAGQALFVKSEVIKSPMGRSLLALPTTEEVNTHIRKFPGKALGWEEVQDL